MTKTYSIPRVEKNYFRLVFSEDEETGGKDAITVGVPTLELSIYLDKAQKGKDAENLDTETLAESIDAMARCLSCNLENRVITFDELCEKCDILDFKRISETYTEFIQEELNSKN